MQLRPYQQACLDTTLAEMKINQNVLVQAATGAGKTIFFSALIRHCMQHYRMRIGVVAHREQLVRQARDKLLKVWPEGESQIGLACASVSSTVDLARPVVIGSPQTLANRLGDMPPLHLLIVDECHRLPPMNVESQYGDLINRLRQYYAAMRLIGVTATPYRLGHGYIYGTRCRKNAENWFDFLAYAVSIKTLQEQGYLVPYYAFEADAPDLSGVRTSGGEYNLAALGTEMGTEVHLGSAVNAVRDYAADRQHIVVFAVTIEHAEALCKVFRRAGYEAAAVHSKQRQEERLATLDAFDHGRLRIVCNVGVLTEGWDCPTVDCMVMCRPTLSPALYVQMVGRGLRLAEGKTDCLLLDLSGNWRRHGDPNDPIVRWQERGAKKTAGELQQEEEAAGTECPGCKHLVTNRAITCPYCGKELKTVNNDRLQLHTATTPPPTAKALVKRARVLSFDAGRYTSRAGNTMLKLAMQCQPEDSIFPVSVNHFMDIEGRASDWGMNRARRLWMRLTEGSAPPESIGEAETRIHELHIPPEVGIRKNGNYWNVEQWG